jgi:hypothetical protein
MILLKSNQLNKIIVTLTQNTTLCDPEYLFQFVHIFSKQEVKFILPDVSPHPTRYNQFEFVEGQGVGEIPFPYEGQYNYYVYSQLQGSSNLNPLLATELVENGIAEFIVVSADTTNENYFEFISSDEFNSNTIFAPDEINPPTPTSTIPPTPTPTSSVTPTVTQTPTNTPTGTETPTPTPTNTPTQTQTQTPSVTPTNTSTPTNTPTQTQTQTPTNTSTPTNTPSETPTQTPTITSTPTETPTQTPTNTSTPTQTPSETPTQTPTQTPTNTQTPSETPTQTPTITQTPTNTGTPTPSPTPPASGTTEANAYLTAVVNAGGTGITSTVSAATVTLFTSLVSNGLYDKITAFYPLLGGNSDGCKFNAKNPINTDAAYRLTFFGGWTFNPSGATSNGTTAYADTFLAPSAQTLNSQHYSIYMGNNNVYTGVGKNYFGCAQVVSSTQYYNVIGQDGAPRWFYGVSSRGSNPVLTPNTQGFILMASSGSTNEALYRNGSIISTSIPLGRATMTRTNYIAAMNNGTAIQHYDNQYRFVTMGSGLTAAEVSTLSTIINTFQTTLGRNTY